ncbi:MAG: AraC family transcriptional regulator [Alteromonadaceae bacterium]|nr:AraC family transcriptional regulator [Alteromonadaceae bacterium]
MINWKIIPENPDVAKFVECYWFLEKEQTDDIHKYPKLNPDPSGTLIIAPNEQRYHYDNTSMSFEGVGSHWIFPNCQTFQMDHSQPFLIFGIKFKIGALYSLNINPKQPVIDQVIDVDINALINSETFSGSSILSTAKLQPDICCAMMDELIKPWLLENPQDKHSKLTGRAVTLLSNNPVSHIGELLHCSQRTIERSFIRVTGFTLKQCQSMNKLEAVLAHLSQLKENDINWLNITYEFGFSDQPHLIRYLKNIIGATPGEYIKERDLTIDIYGGFESP